MHQEILEEPRCTNPHPRLFKQIIKEKLMSYTIFNYGIITIDILTTLTLLHN